MRDNSDSLIVRPVGLLSINQAKLSKIWSLSLYIYINIYVPWDVRYLYTNLQDNETINRLCVKQHENFATGVHTAHAHMKSSLKMTKRHYLLIQQILNRKKNISLRWCVMWVGIGLGKMKKFGLADPRPNPGENFNTQYAWNVEIYLGNMAKDFRAW